jgi:hypothetical protein
MTKKAPVSLDIKMAGGKKTKKVNRPIINSPVITEGTGKSKKEIVVVDKCISISQDIENLIGELKLLESQVIDVAIDARKKEHDDDNFIKTIDVKGTELKMQIQFRDAYSKMAIAMREPLKEIFGAEKYAIMFTEEKLTTIREEKITELKEILGSRYSEFVDVDESIKPSKDFQFNYFTMRKTLKPDQTKTVQQILDACQSNPAVKYPK